MAEDHRRVEPRSIVGTGMVNDPERLEKIGEEAARRERASRGAPEQTFGAVLEHAPAKGALIDDVEPDPKKKKQPTTPEEQQQQQAEQKPEQKAEAKKPTSSTPRPSLPDPREKLLRQKLQALENVAAKKPLLSSETPPTGNSRMKK